MTSKSKLAILLICSVFFLLIGGYVSYISGEDYGPDLINYHHYSGNAVLTGSIEKDIFVANIQGYFNPLPYVPYVYLLQTAGPLATGLIFGAAQGLIGFVTYLLMLSLYRRPWKMDAQFIAFLSGILAFFSPFVIGTIGGSFSDTLQSVFVILSLVLFIYVLRVLPERGPTLKVAVTLLLSGMIMGAACSVKSSHFFYAVATIPMLLTLPGSLRTTLIMVAVYGFGGIAGVCLINGWWGLHLYAETGSPFFPFMSGIFPSNAITINPQDLNFPAQAAARSILEALAYPFQWVEGKPPRSEWGFTDVRMAVFFILLAASAIIPLALRTAAMKERAKRVTGFFEETFITRAVLAVAIFFFFSYVQWIFLLGAVRYIIEIFALSGVLILLGVVTLTKAIRPRFWVLGVSACAALILIAMKPVYYGRVPWTEPWYPAKLPEELKNEPAVYLKDMESIYLPFFHPKSVFIGIYSLIDGGGFLEKAEETIRNWKGPLRILVGEYGNSVNTRDKIYRYLDKKGWRIDYDQCQFVDLLYGFYSCDIVRPDKSAGAETEAGHEAMFHDMKIALNKPLPPHVRRANNLYERRSFGRIIVGDKAAIEFDPKLKGLRSVDLVMSASPGFASEVPIEVRVGSRVVGVSLTRTPKTFTVKTDPGENKQVIVISSKRACFDDGTRMVKPGADLYMFMHEIRLNSSKPPSPGKADQTDIQGKLPLYSEALKTLRAEELLQSSVDPMPPGQQHPGPGWAWNGRNGWDVSSGATLSIPHIPRDSVVRINLRAALLAKSGSGAITISLGTEQKTVVFDSCFSPANLYFDGATSGGADVPMKLFFQGDVSHLQVQDLSVEVLKESDHAKLSFAEYGDTALTSLKGFDAQEPGGLWTISKDGEIELPFLFPQSFVLAVRGMAFGPNQGQPIFFTIGDTSVEGRFGQDLTRQILIFNGIKDSKNKIFLKIPKPTAPNEISNSTDGRKLGLHLNEIKVMPILPLSGDLNIDLTKPDNTREDNVGLSGFSIQEPSGRWTNGAVAKIATTSYLPDEFLLTMEAFAFGPNVDAPVRVQVGKETQELRFEARKGTRFAHFTNTGGKATEILVHIPRPASPNDLDPKSTDLRKLGLLISSLSIGSISARIENLDVDLGPGHDQKGGLELSGFSIQEPSGRWTNGAVAKIATASYLPDEFLLTMEAFAFGPNVDAPVMVQVGKETRELRFGARTTKRSVRFTNTGGKATEILVRIPRPTSPNDLDPKSTDLRKLGLLVSSLSIGSISAQVGNLDVDLRRPDHDKKDGLELSGFSIQEPSGRWTNGPDARILTPHYLPEKFRLTVEAYAFGPNVDAPIRVQVGKETRELRFGARTTTRSVSFTKTGGKATEILLHIPKPTSPNDLDPKSTDLRKLGLMIGSLSVRPEH